jgi:hypothetical protein
VTNTNTSATTYEAETLATTSSAIGFEVGSDAGASGGKYTQFNQAGTPAVGDYIEFTLPNIVAGTYTVDFYYKGYTARGINQASIDSTAIGSVTDEYTSAYTNLNFKTLGSTTFTAGNHFIRFTITGKRTAATIPYYGMTIDKIVLTPQAPYTATATSTATGTVSATTTVSSTATSTSMSAIVNLSLGKSVSYSSQQTGKEAVRGNDGDSGTDFCPNSAALPNWWEVDLGASYNLTSTDISFQQSSGYYKYKIEVSTNNSAWTTVVDQTNNTTRNGTTLSDGFTATARYVKITINYCSISWAWGCFMEFTVWGYASTPTSTTTTTATGTTLGTQLGTATTTATATSTALPATTNLSLGKSVTSISQQGGKPATQGNDGNAAAEFCPSSGALPDWWRVDLGASYTLSSTDINFEKPAAYYKYKIEVSTNDSTWTTVVDQTNNTTRNGTTVTDSFSATARYVRITINYVSTGDWGCFWELTVWGYAATPTSTATTTATGTGIGTATTTLTGTTTGTKTATATNTTPTTLTSTVTVTQTNTNSSTGTQNFTGTNTSTQAYPCGSVAGTDTVNCDASKPTTSGYCNANSGIACSMDSTCASVTKGDFCRLISSSDGSGRRLNESCMTYSGSPWGNCKHGVTTIGATCSSGDTSCNTALAYDFCTEGQPAKMCADTGLWCASVADCPGNAATDLCVPATSRMMTVKRALRRAMTEYADKVNFGFMNMYQGRGISATATDATTAIFPYVKLQVPCPTSNNITETKFLTRGELEKSGCFSLTAGPSSSCTIDYGGNGAINSTASLNQIAYSLVGTNDSRWMLSRGSSKGPENHVSASWSSCSSSTILPVCAFAGQGTGVYQGSYYTFSYKQGTPIGSSGVDGEGSRAHPTYFTSYKGKYYVDIGGNCYNAVDVDRTDIVNDGIYDRPAYTGNPYNSANEVQVPWGGSTSPSTCGGTTGAVWNSGVVPFLNSTVTQTSTGTSTSTATTFGGKVLTTAQKTLMTTARLEKASFGGVDAVGSLKPIGCALGDAGSYMSTVEGNDVTINHGNTPCWSNNIILVVDGQSNGPGDASSSADCASAACAYNADSNPTLTGCSCTAITTAYSLAHSGTPIQTHVVVNAPATWSTRYPYSYAMLWNMAVAGSPNFDGTPVFGTTEEEVYQGVVSKIAASQSRFPFTTTGAVAGPSTQSPLGIITYSGMLYDTSVDYPSWAGSVRAYQTSSGFAELQWDAITVPASVAATYGRDWKSRRVFFSSATGTVAQVQINSDGSIGNQSALHSAGLGATDAEAGAIMQWLLGNPASNNPAPLMGSVTTSTPIVVGQPADNGLNGAKLYSQNNANRPNLLYVGGDDGMLHAFFAQPATLSLKYSGASLTFMGGEEAFAFIPNDMLSVITRQYAQGGQKISPDQASHIFGLAGSPKVKDLCKGSTCAKSDGSDWHTVLVMPEGIGGNKPFALDITGVIDQTNLLAQAPSLLWDPGIKMGSSDATTWDQSLGQTESIPAFYFNGYSLSTGAADNRMVLASGYRTKAGSTYDNQGLRILNVDAVTGAVNEYKNVSNSTSCSQTRAVLADIALARDYSSAQTAQNLRAGYVGDTWGNLYQYVPGQALYNPALFQFGCGQPIHFAPAVVQLERANVNSPSKGLIYVVQVTNSNLDSATQPVSSAYPPSELVVTRLNSASSPPAVDATFNTTGQIVLTLNSSATTNRICLNTTIKDGTITCPDGAVVPSTARPMGTPTAILRPDGLGFQVITTWYDATAISNNCSSGHQFSVGTSYITVHEFDYNGAWYQIAGMTVAGSVVTGVAFAGTGLFVDGILNGGGGVAGQTIAGQTFGSAQQLANGSSLERYTRTNWTERLDL